MKTTNVLFVLSLVLAHALFIPCWATTPATTRISSCQDPAESTKTKDLEELKLKPETIARLKTQSRGLIHYEDFKAKLPLANRALYMGVYADRLFFPLNIKAVGLDLPDLKKFSAEDLERSVQEAIEAFGNVVFFVPPDLNSMLEAITSQEFSLMMRHPEWVKNTLFVYGGYESKQSSGLNFKILTPKKFWPDLY